MLVGECDRGASDAGGCGHKARSEPGAAEDPIADVELFTARRDGYGNQHGNRNSDAKRIG